MLLVSYIIFLIVSLIVGSMLGGIYLAVAIILDVVLLLLLIYHHSSKYNYICPHCNNSGYAYSNELFSYVITTDAQYGSNPTVPIIETAPCLICGEPVPVSMWENHAKICDKCKKAILKLRKMFDEE